MQGAEGRRNGAGGRGFGLEERNPVSNFSL